MSAGRMRFTLAVLATETRTPTGAMADPKWGAGVYYCDIVERDTSEANTGERLSQTRTFDVTLRTAWIKRDATVQLTFGCELLECAVFSVVQNPRKGETKLVAVHEDARSTYPN